MLTLPLYLFPSHSLTTQYQHGGMNYGFVEFVDHLSAEQALLAMNGRKIFSSVRTKRSTDWYLDMTCNSYVLYLASYRKSELTGLYREQHKRKIHQIIFIYSLETSLPKWTIRFYPKHLELLVLCQMLE